MVSHLVSDYSFGKIFFARDALTAIIAIAIIAIPFII